MRSVVHVIAALITMGIVLASVGTALAQEEEPPYCPPRIHLDLPVQGMAVPHDEDRSELDMRVCNGSGKTQGVRFQVKGAPEGWSVAVRPTFGAYEITSLVLDPGAIKDLRLRFDMPETKKEGVHTLTLQALSSAGAVLQEIPIAVGVTSGKTAEAGSITLSSTYPVLEGPASSVFEFEVSIRNNTGEDSSFELSAEASERWSVAFAPTFGEERLFSSINVADKAVQRFNVKVQPNRQAGAGSYPVVVTAGNEQVQEQTLLRVDVTGNFDVLVTTATERLNMDATAGEATPGALRVVNTGTAALENLALLADTPTDWKVEFDFADISALEPNFIQDVPFTVTPKKDAIPGDYFITIHARNPQALDSASIRVTVEQSTVWGWFGLGLVVVVIGGLVGLFVRLGRR